MGFRRISKNLLNLKIKRRELDGPAEAGRLHKVDPYDSRTHEFAFLLFGFELSFHVVGQHSKSVRPYGWMMITVECDHQFEQICDSFHCNCISSFCHTTSMFGPYFSVVWWSTFSTLLKGLLYFIYVRNQFCLTQPQIVYILINKVWRWA